MSIRKSKTGKTKPVAKVVKKRVQKNKNTPKVITNSGNTCLYPKSQHLSSVNDTLVVGQRYDYKEDWYIGEVLFLGDVSNDDFHILKLKWILAPDQVKSQDGEEFEVSWKKGEPMYCYSGAWHILPLGSYWFGRRQPLR